MCVFVCAQHLVYIPCKIRNSVLAMPECSDKGPNKDSNGKKKIKENCNTSNLIMHIIKINVDMSTADEEQRETILGFGILFVFLFSGVLYILLEFLCVDLHNQFNNVINQCYLFLHCGL